MMPIIIFGGIYGGIFTATEAGAISALYGLLYYVIRKRTNPLAVSGSVMDMMKFTISLTGVIMFIMTTANIACKAIAFSGVSQELVVWMTTHISSPIVFMLIVNVIFLICGMFIDSNAAILLFVPLLTPIADAYGIDQVQLAGIILVNLCVGAISPPFLHQCVCHHQNEERQVCGSYPLYLALSVLLYFRVADDVLYPWAVHVAPLSA